MENLLLLIPWVFFILGGILGIYDNSAVLLKEYGFTDKYYSASAPIHKLRQAIRQTTDPKRKKALEKAYKAKVYSIICGFMGILSTILLGYLFHEK